VIAFGDADDVGAASDWRWHAVIVDEASYAYFARAPSLKIPTAERLRYFARYLEHANPLVAEDAYLEFGHAPFDEVARAADVLPAAKMRAWLVDQRVPQARKGFYGLAIALCATSDEKRTVADFLRRLILEPDDDFRGGFDGILGGYLLLSSAGGLELVESRYLANPRAADGDVRHALTALRFYREYGHDIPTERLSQALAKLIVRNEFAEAAVTDLARWKAWDVLDQVVRVYRREGSTAGARRAVVGYLLTCPEANAREALADLRRRDPQGVAAAEKVLSATSSVPANE
jgi:hypothetical protein